VNKKVSILYLLCIYITTFHGLNKSPFSHDKTDYFQDDGQGDGYGQAIRNALPALVRVLYVREPPVDLRKDGKNPILPVTAQIGFVLAGKVIVLFLDGYELQNRILQFPDLFREFCVRL
jgi:hypothetical protein